MIKEIEIKRDNIKQYFDETAKIDGTEFFGLSEYGIYFFEAQQYQQTDPNRNWVVTKIQIGHIEKEGYFFEYVTDHDDDSFLWIYKDEKHYLLFPEFQGGQSIFDIEAQKLHSYYAENDSFIWQSVFISPDKTKLAVTGCYWACPYEIVVYDCTNVTELPYPYIYRQSLESNFEIKEWLDNTTILLTTINNKQEKKIVF